VNRADVRVIQRGGRLGFALKAAESLRILGNIVGKKFKRHKAMQASVFRLVDHAHASAAELLDDPVMRDGLADHGRGNGRRASVPGQPKWRRKPWRLMLHLERRELSDLLDGRSQDGGAVFRV